MHSNFYEVRISKIGPVATRAPPGMQNMRYEQKYGQNEHLARANKAPDGPNRSPAWSRGLPRYFDFPAGRVGGFGVHGSTGGATGAGFGLLYFDWRFHALRPWPSGPGPEPMPVLLLKRGTSVTTNGSGKKPLARRTLALLQCDS
jgi:hypothetical protein